MLNTAPLPLKNIVLQAAVPKVEAPGRELPGAGGECHLGAGDRREQNVSSREFCSVEG